MCLYIVTGGFEVLLEIVGNYRILGLEQVREGLGVCIIVASLRLTLKTIYPTINPPRHSLSAKLYRGLNEVRGSLETQIGLVGQLRNFILHANIRMCTNPNPLVNIGARDLLTTTVSSISDIVSIH